MGTINKMFANTNNANLSNGLSSTFSAFKEKLDTVNALKELKELMYNPMYDLQAQVAILHNENNATILYADGTQFEMEKR